MAQALERAALASHRGPAVIRATLEKARRLPPGAVWRRAGGFAMRHARAFVARRRDGARSTYAKDGGMLLERPLAPPLAAIAPHRTWLAGVTPHYLAHRFDLLGSGWVEVGREGADAAAWLEGRINAANLAEAQRIWRLIDDPAYRPIDWQLDVKSGTRWREDCWYLDVPFGHAPGADIKVPWELARMQHLPQLALAYRLAASGEPGFAAPGTNAREIRNQILDFIATNPPRFGGNWRTAMDVAIRAVNWLIARALLEGAGTRFDAAFEAVLARSIREHARHIAANLETLGSLRANHYLADICGLAFCAHWLPAGPETDAWRDFAARELAAEVEAQFNDDGSNFEASTCYHALSAEMVVYTTAILPGPFSERHIRRLAGMARFTQAIAKPSGRSPQIGDNDSGRFLKLAPVYRAISVAEAKRRYATLANWNGLAPGTTYWDEDALDHRSLVAAVAGLFGDAAPDRLETAVVRALAGGRTLPPAPPVAVPRLDLSPPPAAPNLLARIEIVAPGGSLRDGLALQAFPDFGLYLYRSRRLYLLIRCGAIGQRGRGGHAHNDQLAVELAIDGEDWIVDPGTYVYTPDPEARNRYRSVKAHFAPRLGAAEPARLDRGLFWLPDDPLACCHRFAPDGFLGSHRGFGKVITRQVAVGETSIVIEDRTEKADAGPPAAIVCTGRDETSASLQPPLPISPGYGVLLKR
ncbi:MAG: alginate lyase family protein [Pseudomonadota bacterium]